MTMRVVYDDTMRYEGYHKSKAHCHLRLYVPERLHGDLPVAIVTELPTNDGTSVTNVAERVHEAIWGMGRTLNAVAFAEGFVHIEHYPWQFQSEQQADRILSGTQKVYSTLPATWSVVDFSHVLDKPDGVRKPEWKYVPVDEIERIIGGPLEQRSAQGVLPLVFVHDTAIPWDEDKWLREMMGPVDRKRA